MSPAHVLARMWRRLARAAGSAAGRLDGHTVPEPNAPAPVSAPGAGALTLGGGPGASLLDVLHDAVYSLSPDQKILTWNAAAQRIYGYTAQEVIGRTPSDALVTRFASGERRDEVFAELDRVGHVRRDLVERRRDGTDIFVEGSAVVVRARDGGVAGYVLVSRDVTERKRAEEALRVADRMASIGTLAAGVAHEINNPLAFILSNLNYLAQELGKLDPVPADLVEAVEDTRQGAVRVRDIVRDLKTFSRADDRGVDEPVDVRGVLQSSVNLTQSELRRRARLVLELEDVPRVHGSQHKLGQVFVNLLFNAAQAIAEPGADGNEIRVRCRAGDGTVVVEVSDTGCGIQPDHLGRIFEPFFTTKPFGVGSGLGLSICHGIVAQLGGTIEVESRVGRGSTFRVQLPVARRAEAVPAPRGAAAAPPCRPPHVLVVDDEPMVANAVARTLGPQHQVVAVSSGRAALAHIESGAAVDVVVCDLMMPEMSGMELHASVQARHPDLAGRMVFLTGGAFTDGARSFLERIPNARLEKPFDTATLRAVVREALATARA